MSSFMLTTPVALLVFNRPAETARVFAAIREARPARLLIVADGPRVGRGDDGALCAEVRRLVAQVDWPCEVRRNYADVNLGCRQRVASGLDWVFAQVEDAIILEDDCLPDPAFFRFCQELLERYRHDPRVGMISGDNFQFGLRHNDDSYYFSRYFHIWGWASWRDRWAGNYDVTLAKWPLIKDGDWIANMAGDGREAAHWRKIFERVYRGEIDTWDYQWVFANWLQGRLSILPAVNMISNIGFDERATHTTADSCLANLERNSIDFPLSHPPAVIQHIKADQCSRHMYSGGALVESVRRKLAGWLR